MPLEFQEGADRYEALRSVKWHSDGPPPRPTPAGARVEVAKRGFVYTDADGRTVAVNGLSRGPVMATLINESWKNWVIPKLEEMKANGIEIPTQIENVLIRLGRHGVDVGFNAAGSQAQFLIRRGRKFKKGDLVTLDDIVDLGAMEPPTWEDKPVAYCKIAFDGNQIFCVFDFRPNETPLDAWDEQTKTWYGTAHGVTLFTRFFGHLPDVIPRLTALDVPFTIGLPASKMRQLLVAAEEGKSRQPIEQLLEKLVDASDWESRMADWKSSQTWGKRAKVFDDALACYKQGTYGGAVLQLMAQIEGVVMAELIANSRGVNNNGKAKDWPQRLNELETILKAKAFGPFRTAIASAALYFLRNSNLYQAFRWTSSSNPVNRHAALHGSQLDYGTKGNADRLFLLMDALYWLLCSNTSREETVPQA